MKMYLLPPSQANEFGETISLDTFPTWNPKIDTSTASQAYVFEVAKRRSNSIFNSQSGIETAQYYN